MQMIYKMLRSDLLYLTPHAVAPPTIQSSVHSIEATKTLHA